MGSSLTWVSCINSTQSNSSLPTIVYKKCPETDTTLLNLMIVKRMVSVYMFVIKTIYCLLFKDLDEEVSLQCSWKKSMLYQVTILCCYIGDCLPCCLGICQPLAASGLLSNATSGLLSLAALGMLSHIDAALGFMIGFAAIEELDCPKGLASVVTQEEDDISLTFHGEDMSALLPREREDCSAELPRRGYVQHGIPRRDSNVASLVEKKKRAKSENFLVVLGMLQLS